MACIIVYYWHHWNNISLQLCFTFDFELVDMNLNISKVVFFMNDIVINCPGCKMFTAFLSEAHL